MALNEGQTYEKLRNQLKKTTAYTPNVAPTAGGLAKQRNLMRIQAKEEFERGEKLKEQWYGSSEAKKRGPGRLSTALKTLGMPVSGIAGGVEAILGKGTEKGLMNIPANIKERGTFGDIIRAYGVNNAIAMPLGFALDIFADPLSWATFGTAATIPKIGYGLAKAGPRGAMAGARAAGLQAVETAGRAVPGLAKRAFGKLDEASDVIDGVRRAGGPRGPVAQFYRNVSQKSVDATREYEKLIGKTLEDRLQALASRTTVFELGEKWLTEKGGNWEKGLGFFGYSSQKWTEAAKLKELEKAGKLGVNVVEEVTNPFDVIGKGVRSDRGPRTISNEIMDGADLVNAPYWSRSSDSLENMYRMRGEASKDEHWGKLISKELTEMEDMLRKGNYVKQADKIKKVAIETPDGGKYFTATQEDLATTMQYYKAQINGYDKQIARVLSSDYGRKFMKNYAIYIGLFKNAKIGGNLLTAGTNAVVGNLTMTGMMGIDILNAGYARAVKKAITIAKGKDYKAITEILGQPDVHRVMQQYPDLFQGVFGVNPKLVLKGEAYIDEVAAEYAKTGGNLKGLDEIKAEFKRVFKGEITASRNFLSSTVPGARQPDIPSTFITSEVMRGPYGLFKAGVDKKAKEGVPFAKFFSWYLNKPMEAYNKVDQTFRLAGALHLSQHGVNARELTQLAKRIRLNPQDYTKIAGRNLYKIDFEKAMDITTEAYMNYLAMPAFVQIMRTLPIMSSPFFSFAYGMGALTAKTGAYNPAFFNKMQFLLREISGNKSPLEKEALGSKYYEWFNQEGMVKLNMLPFFEDNPYYLNMENMIPYYTMNVFQPQERSYESRFGRVAASLFDKTPFFNDPVGQLMVDYMILPNLIRGEQARGQFGQPLWRKDAGLLNKFGTMVRAGAESLVPPLIGYAGIITPESIAPVLPSYRWRGMTYAKYGKGSTGVPTKEPPSEKTKRLQAALAGWSTYQMKLYSTEPKDKK